MNNNAGLFVVVPPLMQLRMMLVFQSAAVLPVLPPYRINDKQGVKNDDLVACCCVILYDSGQCH